MSPAILNLLLAAKLTLAATATGDNNRTTAPDGRSTVSATVTYEAIDAPIGDGVFANGSCGNNGGCGNNGKC